MWLLGFLVPTLRFIAKIHRHISMILIYEWSSRPHKHTAPTIFRPISSLELCATIHVLIHTCLHSAWYVVRMSPVTFFLRATIVTLYYLCCRCRCTYTNARHGQRSTKNGERKKKNMDKNSLETNNCNEMNKIQSVCLRTIVQSMLGFFWSDERPLFFSMLLCKKTKFYVSYVRRYRLMPQHTYRVEENL